MNLLEVSPRENFRLFLRYDNGVSGEVDLSELVGRGVFSAWSNADVFRQVRLTETGHPEWSGSVDLCPDALYMQLTGKSPIYEEFYKEGTSNS